MSSMTLLIVHTGSISNWLGNPAGVFPVTVIGPLYRPWSSAALSGKSASALEGSDIALSQRTNSEGALVGSMASGRAPARTRSEFPSGAESDSRTKTGTHPAFRASIAPVQVPPLRDELATTKARSERQ